MLFLFSVTLCNLYYLDLNVNGFSRASMKRLYCRRHLGGILFYFVVSLTLLRSLHFYSSF